MDAQEQRSSVNANESSNVLLLDVEETITDYFTYGMEVQCMLSWQMAVLLGIQSYLFKAYD